MQSAQKSFNKTKMSVDTKAPVVVNAPNTTVNNAVSGGGRSSGNGLKGPAGISSLTSSVSGFLNRPF